MNNLWLVFVGGGAGSLARYAVGQQVFRLAGPGWPWATFAVNILGGFLMGCLVGFLAHRGSGDQARWTMLFGTGLLGGFTTFSAFSLETALMFERKQYVAAGAYAAASVLLSVAALWGGLLFTRRVFA